MTQLLMTRRSAIGTGLAAISIAATSGAAHAGTARPFDVLFVDAGIALPAQLTAFVSEQRKSVPVIDIRLDAAGYAGIKSVLDRNGVALGFSTGATLFCLERIAWDHGFRLTGHSRHDLGQGRDDPSARRELAAFLGGALPPVRGSQPSGSDGGVHLWRLERGSGSLREGRT